jgi:hypothetical protein
MPFVLKSQDKRVEDQALAGPVTDVHGCGGPTVPSHPIPNVSHLVSVEFGVSENGGNNERSCS